MKSKKAIKRLTRVEKLLADVQFHYSAIEKPLGKLLSSAKASVAGIRESIAKSVSAKAAQAKSAKSEKSKKPRKATAGKAGKAAPAKKKAAPAKAKRRAPTKSKSAKRKPATVKRLPATSTSVAEALEVSTLS